MNFVILVNLCPNFTATYTKIIILKTKRDIGELLQILIFYFQGISTFYLQDQPSQKKRNWKYRKRYPLLRGIPSKKGSSPTSLYLNFLYIVLQVFMSNMQKTTISASICSVNHTMIGVKDRCGKRACFYQIPPKLELPQILFFDQDLWLRAVVSCCSKNY